MDDWSNGYVTDLGYTFGYYDDLNPHRSKLSLILKGLTPPAYLNACELGFGQGLSINIHSSASQTNWFGTDFNPSQAHFAQNLATSYKSQAKLFDESFADFSERQDLPEFDYIGLHGIWSWVSDENRNIIVNFIRKKLKVGGLLYISYNTLPGWAAKMPIREIMTYYSNHFTPAGDGVIRKIDQGIEFLGNIESINPIFFRANPAIAAYVDELKKQDRNYLAHEYFNKDWKPCYFHEMHSLLKEAKLSFACSANYHDQIDNINLTNEQQLFLKNFSDPVFKQIMRDYCINQQFRKDYWIKGPVQLSASEQLRLFHNVTLIMTIPCSKPKYKLQSVLGEVSLDEKIYAPIYEFFSDYRSHKIIELENSLAKKSIDRSHIIQALFVLIGSNIINICQDDQDIKKSSQSTSQLNSHLINLSRVSNDISYLASPVTGGGINVNRFEQLFLLASTEGAKTKEDYAKFAWQCLEQMGQSIVVDGKPLQNRDDNLNEMMRKADEFITDRLSILKSLKICY